MTYVTKVTFMMIHNNYPLLYFQILVPIRLYFNSWKIELKYYSIYILSMTQLFNQEDHYVEIYVYTSILKVIFHLCSKYPITYIDNRFIFLKLQLIF